MDYPLFPVFGKVAEYFYCIPHFYIVMVSIVLISGLLALIGILLHLCRNRRKKLSQNLVETIIVPGMFSGVRGKFCFNTPLSSYNRLRVGGPAQILFRPSDLSDLVKVLKRKPKEMQVTVLGMGSNVLIRDGGIPGLVIKLEKGFSEFFIDRNTMQVEVGAGLSQLKFSKLCAKEGIGGLEFFCGIPGTIGGALRMNAGAHGVEVKDRLLSATLVDEHGNLHVCDVSQLNYSYRACGIPKNWIFVSARFQGVLKSKSEIEECMQKMMEHREQVQPVNARTAGCTFANFDVDQPAWKLITDAGCQGLRHGDAMISEKHANFLINTNSATARDLEDLGNFVQRKVLQKFGVLLRWEVERIGV